MISNIKQLIENIRLTNYLTILYIKKLIKQIYDKYAYDSFKNVYLFLNLSTKLNMNYTKWKNRELIKNLNIKIIQIYTVIILNIPFFDFVLY